MKIELVDPVEVEFKSLSRSLIEALLELEPGRAVKIPRNGLGKRFASNCHTVAGRKGMRVKTRYNATHFFIWQRE